MKIGNNLRQYTRFGIMMLGFAIAGSVSALLMNAAMAQGTESDPQPTSDERLISLHDRGVERTILTKARTVREALKAAQVDIAEGQDVVEPGLDEELIATKYNVNIYRARPVTIIDGALRQRVITAHQTPKQIAKVANITLYPEDKVVAHSGDLLVHGADTVFEIDRATPVSLTLYGKQTEVRTHVATVGELLKEKNITLGKDDTLSLPASAPITNGMQIELWRNGTQTVSVDEEIGFTTEKIQDANRDPSYHEVKERGENGKKTVTYEIEMRNGVEISRKEIASVTAKEPKKQVEVVGAKFTYTGGPLSEAQIQALGMCESGMTATRNSGNGFYGAFQFMSSTWRTVAPAPYNQGMPHEAPLEAQKQAVQNLLSRSNIFTQFPGCANKMRAQGIL
jgi:uncharacterized protein YabE (DUF348 family)